MALISRLFLGSIRELYRLTQQKQCESLSLVVLEVVFEREIDSRAHFITNQVLARYHNTAEQSTTECLE